VTKEFVAVGINITDVGFPKDVAGLKLWEGAFEKERSFKVGFATSVVLGPGGQMPFGTSGCGHREEWKTSINYHPEKYLKFLDESRERHLKAKAVVEDKELDEAARAAKLKELGAETLKAIQEAAKCVRAQK
jgi:hypothetical protein